MTLTEVRTFVAGLDARLAVELEKTYFSPEADTLIADQSFCAAGLHAVLHALSVFSKQADLADEIDSLIKLPLLNAVKESRYGRCMKHFNSTSIQSQVPVRDFTKP